MGITMDPDNFPLTDVKAHFGRPLVTRIPAGLESGRTFAWGSLEKSAIRPYVTYACIIILR